MTFIAYKFLVMSSLACECEWSPRRRSHVSPSAHPRTSSPPLAEERRGEERSADCKELTFRFTSEPAVDESSLSIESLMLLTRSAGVFDFALKKFIRASDEFGGVAKGVEKAGRLECV